MRETWVYDRKLKKPVLKQAQLPSQAAGPSVITDTMPDTWHPASGKHYSSKSRFRAETKARGLTEYGTEKLTPRKPVEMSPVRNTVRQAIEMVKQGYRPQPLERASIERGGNLAPIPIDRIKNG